MYDPSDVSKDTIQNLFFRQVRRNTMRACGLESFDIQFSDSWL